MDNKADNNVSKKFLYTIMGISIFFICIIAFFIVAFINRDDKMIEKVENGGQITLNYTNNVTGLSLKNIAPTVDSIAMKDLTENNYFDFFIDLDLKKAKVIEYEISVINNKDNSTIPNDDIKIYLEKEESGTYSKVFGPDKYTPIKEKTELGSEKGSMILLKSKATKTTKDNYRLRMWLSDQSTLPSGDYSLDVVVNGIAK